MSKKRFFTMIVWILAAIMVMVVMPAAANTGNGGSSISKDITERYTPTEYQSFADAPDQVVNGTKTVQVVPSMDPNQDLTAKISFKPTGDKTMDLVFDLGDFVLSDEEWSLDEENYTCIYDKEYNCLIFTWKEGKPRDAFSIELPVKAAYDYPEEWGTSDPYDEKSFVIVANSDNALMIPKQEQQSNKRNVLRSLSCSIINGVVRNNDLDYEAREWTFHHVSDSWYSISGTEYGTNTTKYLAFDNSNGAVLSDTPVALKIEPAGDGMIKISNGTGKYLTSAGNNPANGFGNYNSANNQEMKLIQKTSMNNDIQTKDWDNKTGVIANEHYLNLVADSKKNNNSLKSIKYLMSGMNQVMIPDDSVIATEWTLKNVRGDWYTISSAGNYLTIDGNKLVVSTTAKPLFIRHLEDSTTEEFVLSTNPYSNTTNAKIIDQPSVVKMNWDNVSTQKSSITDVDNYHHYKGSKYGDDVKLRFMTVTDTPEDTLYLIYDSNGVTAATPAIVQDLTANQEVVLGGIDQGDFLGWSTVPGFYTTEQGENNTTYHKLYRAGEKFIMPANTTKLYAVWNKTNLKTTFGIRLNGTIPQEPNKYDTNLYRHVAEFEKNTKEGYWIINQDDSDQTDIVTINNVKYLKNDIIANVEQLPDLDDIQQVFPNYNPETQYVHWYVMKYMGDYWHVDGVIRNRKEVTVNITGHTDEVTYDSKEHTVSGFDVVIEAKDGTNLTKEDIGFNDSELQKVFVKGTDISETPNQYVLGLEESMFEATNPHYLVTFIVKDEGLTIKPKAVTITAKDAKKTYNNRALTQGEFETTALEEGDDHEFTVVMTTGSTITNAGTQANVIAKVDGTEIPVARTKNNDGKSVSAATTVGNYLVTAVDGELEIERKAVTITAKDAKKTYNNSALTQGEFDVTELEEGDDHKFAVAMTTGSTITNAGTQANVIATVDGTAIGTTRTTNAAGKSVSAETEVGNYLVTAVDGELEVERKAVTITADDKSMTYGDEEKPLTATTVGLVGNDYIATTQTREAGKNIGTYQITVNPIANPNYEIKTIPGTLTIEPKPVTVTAADNAKTYGAADPTMKATVTGMAAGESTSLIKYDLSRATGEDVGTYAINATGDAAQGNYTVTYVPATLTILPEDAVIVTITANNGEYEYDGTQRDLSGYSVNINNSLYKESDFTFNGSNALKGVNTGTYRTNMKASDFVNTNTNFEDVLFVVENGTLEITKRDVTLTSGNAEKTFDGTPLTNEEITVSGDGFVTGEGVNVTVTGRRTTEGESDNTFTYTMAANTQAGNYDITPEYGKLKVTENNGDELAEYHKLTITYQYENGNVIKTFARDYMAGTKYYVASDKIAHYKADTAAVSGTMGNADINVTVIYSKATHTLTVKFISMTDSSQVATPVTMELPSGDNYTVFVPAVEGYTAMMDKVTGIMPDSSRSVTVFFLPEGTEAGFSGIGGGTHAPIEIDDFGTPLGIADSILGGGIEIE